MTQVKLLLISIGLIAISGCAHITVLHPIEDIDIVKMEKGVAYTPEKDGWFISDFYLKEVVQAKVDK